MSEVDNGQTPEDAFPSISGNAPIKVKELVQYWLRVFANDGFGARTAQSLNLIEASLVPNANEPTRQEARVVLEIAVTEDMLNAAGNIHGACLIHLVDLCTALAIAAMSFANSRDGLVGVSQGINTIFHAPASLGDKLRLVNTSTTIGRRVWSGRIEIWDMTHRRLVASGTQVKMEASPRL